MSTVKAQEELDKLIVLPWNPWNIWMHDGNYYLKNVAFSWKKVCKVKNNPTF